MQFVAYFDRVARTLKLSSLTMVRRTTGSLIQELGCDKLKYIVHERNLGCSAAYNSCIGASTGDFIAFLDSDDVWEPEYLERQTAFLLRNPRIAGSFTDTKITGESLSSAQRARRGRSPFDKLIDAVNATLSASAKFRERWIRSSTIDRRAMYLCLLREVPIKPSALVVRKGPVVDAGGFDEAWPSGTDWALFIKLSKVIEFGYIDAPLVVQRRTADATHIIHREKDQTFILNVLDGEKRGLAGDPEALKQVNASIAERYNELGHLVMKKGHKRHAAKTYYSGFCETGDIALFVKAATAFLPEGARRAFGARFDDLGHVNPSPRPRGLLHGDRIEPAAIALKQKRPREAVEFTYVAWIATR